MALSAHGTAIRSRASATASAAGPWGSATVSAKHSLIVPLTRASTAKRRVNDFIAHSPRTGTTSRAVRGSLRSG